MPSHIWTILCSRGLIDKFTNAVSLIEVIEELSISPLPKDKIEIVPVSLTLVTLSARSDLEKGETSAGRVSVLMPSGEKLRATQFEINLSAHLRSRNVAHFNSLPVEGQGVYHFVVEFHDSDTDDWREVYRLPVLIKPAEVEEREPAG